MAKRNNPRSAYGQLAALVKVTEGLRTIPLQRKQERYKLTQDRQKAVKAALDSRKAWYSSRREELKARVELEEARHAVEMANLEEERIRVQIEETKERTRGQRLRNQLDNLKLANMDPSLAPNGTTAYECPLCGDYYFPGAINQDLLFCTNPGCNHAPLVKTALNLN